MNAIVLAGSCLTITRVLVTATLKCASWVIIGILNHVAADATQN